MIPALLHNAQELPPAPEASVEQFRYCKWRQLVVNNQGQPLHSSTERGAGCRTRKTAVRAETTDDE